MDTEASNSDTIVPRRVLESIGVYQELQLPFTISDGTRRCYDMAEVRVRVAGSETDAWVVLRDESEGVLLSCHTLQSLRLQPASDGRSLIPRVGTL